MKTGRTPKNYRFPERTLTRLEWLTGRMEMTATDVIESAVDRLYDQKRSELRANLIPKEDGWYDLVVGGLTLLSVEKSALKTLGKHLEQLLSPKGGEDDLFGLVVLSAGSSGSRIKVYPENIRQVYGPVLD